MSQYGALAKAGRGKRAADILAFYYAGLKPVQAPPERLPSSVRVAIDLGRAQARVSAPEGRFRVLDGDGQVVVPVATGSWRVSPGPRASLRVTPPPEQAAPVTVEAMVDPVGAGAAPLTLRLRLSSPAVVRLTATPPGGPPSVVEPEALDGGESTRQLPAAPAPGDYTVVIDADGGPGRSVSVPVTFSVISGAGLEDGRHLASGRAAVAPGAGTGRARLDGRLTAFAVLLLALSAAGVRGSRRAAGRAAAATRPPPG